MSEPQASLVPRQERASAPPAGPGPSLLCATVRCYCPPLLSLPTPLGSHCPLACCHLVILLVVILVPFHETVEKNMPLPARPN